MNTRKSCASKRKIPIRLKLYKHLSEPINFKIEEQVLSKLEVAMRGYISRRTMRRSIQLGIIFTLAEELRHVSKT